MTIAIFGSPYPEHFTKYIQHLVKKLESEHIKIIIEEEFYVFLQNNIRLTSKKETFNSYESLKENADFLLSIGGDGTLLKAVTFVRESNIPIMGINTGRLGFLATIQKEEITDSLYQILNGNYFISKRSLLSIFTNPENENISSLNFALNEIAVNRKNTTSMIKVETLVNNMHLTSYWSDGLIVSTPTGSTGYSLSCGGPVIDPSTNSMVITPIAPHNLNARPLVVPDNCTITLKVSGRGKSHLVSLDSRIATLKNNTIITIKKAPFYIKLVQLSEDSFIKTLRKKLLWGEDKRN